MDNLSETPDPLRVNAKEALRAAAKSQLEDVLEDCFSSDYLLRHSESEFSSENVSFLLVLRDLFAAKEMGGAAAESRIAQRACKEHVQPGSTLEVPLPPALRDRILAWYKQVREEAELPTPTPLWAEAHKICFRNVKFDVYPRFKTAKTAEECFTLHPRRTLLAQALRDAFRADSKLSSLQASGDPLPPPLPPSS